MSNPDYRIAKLDVCAGDILVAKVNGHITAATVDDLRKKFNFELPGVKVLIIDSSIDLAVLSAEEIEKRVVTGDAA